MRTAGPHTAHGAPLFAWRHPQHQTFVSTSGPVESSHPSSAIGPVVLYSACSADAMAQRPVVDVDGCRGRGQAATIAVLPASGAWHLGSSCGACAPVRIWGWFFDLALDATLLRFHSSMEPPLEGRSCASPRAPTNTDLHAHTRRPNCHGDALGPTVHSSTTTATTVERLARRPRCRPQLAHLVRVVRRLCLEGAAKRANQTLCPPSGLARHYRSVSSCGFREARAGTATTVRYRRSRSRSKCRVCTAPFCFSP